MIRPVEPGIFRNLAATQGALQDYREAAANRRQIQAVFLPDLSGDGAARGGGAVWLGIGAANAISAPVARAGCGG